MITNILEYLENLPTAVASKDAFISDAGKITFCELERTAKSIGSYLHGFIPAGNAVAVLTEKDIVAPACFLGVVYAGCFYVPLDDQTPENRLAAILSTVEAGVIVTDKANVARIKNMRYDGTILLVEDAAEYPADEELLRSIREKAMDLDPLYVLFTSGSTGVPKGVVTPHRAVIDYIDTLIETFGFSEKDIFGNQSSFDFVGAIRDIYIPLKTGCTAFIIPKDYFMNPKRLIDCLEENRINVLCWAASAMSVIAALNAFDYAVPRHIEKVLFSGSVLPCRHLRYWQKHLPDVCYVNHYGPTEITASCTYYIVEKEQSSENTIPIGKPFKNTQIFLLNDLGGEAGAGETGEICVKGTCLALGYFNDEQKTREVFIQNPLNDKYIDIVYKTGDLGAFDESGLLWFHGRKDHQVKHMGYRIELDEIEIAANSLPEVDLACCLHDDKTDKLVLFYQAASPCNKAILLRLREMLPKYMLPNKMMHFEQLPYNNNRKIDRVKLREYLD